LWEDDEHHGLGTLYDEVSRRKYVGNWEEGKREGEGREFYTKDSNNNMLMYKGDWHEDERHGYGSLYHESGKLAHVGHWEAGLKHGQGWEHNEEGTLVFHGMFVKGLREGWGICYNKKGDFLTEEQWKEGEKYVEPVVEVKKKRRRKKDDEVKPLTIRYKVYDHFSPS